MPSKTVMELHDDEAQGNDVTQTCGHDGVVVPPDVSHEPNPCHHAEDNNESCEAGHGNGGPEHGALSVLIPMERCWSRARHPTADCFDGRFENIECSDPSLTFTRCHAKLG